MKLFKIKSKNLKLKNWFKDGSDRKLKMKKIGYFKKLYSTQKGEKHSLVEAVVEPELDRDFRVRPASFQSFLQYLMNNVLYWSSVLYSTVHTAKFSSIIFNSLRLQLAFSIPNA